MKMRKILAFVLTIALLLSVNGLNNTMLASAAGKTPKLSKTSVSLKVKESKKVTVKNKPTGAKVTWSSKDKKIAAVKDGKITGKKVGNTKITCKVVYKKNGKKVVKNLVVKVKVEAKQDTEPTPTLTPMPDYSVEVSNLTAEHKSKNGIATKDNGLVREGMTAAQLMKLMGQGWNLGNTLEACGSAEATKGFKVEDFELFWNKIPTTQKLIDGLKSYGINSVRIPVAWSNMMSDDGKYSIDDGYFNRVEEVINYVLSNEMYAIVNIHYDSEWWGQFGDKDEAVRQMAWDRYQAFWKQISERYKEYSDRLIFESANEELGDPLNGNWQNMNRDEKAGVLTQDELYETTNKINQEFVNIVRASGGNNKYRHLLIAGYNTDIDMTYDSRFIMPKDTIEENGNVKLSVSVHYYTPSTYCIAESATNSWGYMDSWGTDEDVAMLHTLFDKMSRFTKEGYGVIIGEYGVCNSSKDGIPKFMEEVMTYSEKLGFLPMLWDTGLWFDRSTGICKFSDIAEIYNKMTGSNGKIADDALLTGISDLKTVPEDELKKLYTWEGSWTRTDGTTAVGGYELKSCDEGLNIESNAYFWQLWVNADWSNMTKPCIKLYMADDELSQNADIQMAYASEANGGGWKGEANPQTGWVEQCLPLDTNLLKDTPWLMLSSNKPGATIVKIEIFDAK